MSGVPEVVPIFATPFGVVSLDEARAANPALATLFTARAAVGLQAAAAGGQAATFHSPDDLLEWQDAAVRPLLQAMLTGVTAVAQSISQLTGEQFATLRLEARGWFTVVGANGYVAPRSFPNTTWAAVYCVAAPPPSPTRQDSGSLRLHESRAGNMFMDSSQGGIRLPYRSGHCVWHPVPGQMAVFPGMITHEVALLRADSPLILVFARVRYVGEQQPWMPPW